MSGSTGFVAKSGATMAVLERAKRAAEHSDPVLITGETGTGKELIARIIHNGRGPLVVVDCTHLTEDLATRELLGNERGAYTGADQRRPGAFQAADGGTVFLDEIGELPLPIQAKLLRIIQERAFTPLGSTHECRVQCRIIAATNRDLKTEVKMKRFREDLFYRLDVIKIHIPPLRERREDLELLIAHFARKNHLTLRSAAIEILLNFGWPGNVRQLENVIRKVAIEKQNQIADIHDLPRTLMSCSFALESKATLSAQTISPIGHQVVEGPKTITEIERQAILASLTANGGRRDKAAAELKLSRATLYRRLKKMRADNKLCATLSRALKGK